MDYDIYASLNEFLLHYETVRYDIDRNEIVNLFYTDNDQRGVVSSSDYYLNNPCVDFSDSFIVMNNTQFYPLDTERHFINKRDAVFTNGVLSINSHSNIKTLFRKQYCQHFRISTVFGDIPKHIDRLQITYDRLSGIVNFIVRN